MNGESAIRSLHSALVASAVGAVLGAAGCGGDTSGERGSGPSTIPQPAHDQFVAAGMGKLPLARQSRRLDITAPTFTNPTNISNPLFPVSRLRSPARLTAIDAHLVGLRETVSSDTEDLATAREEALQLADPLALEPVTAKD